jgi:DNA primase
LSHFQNEREGIHMQQNATMLSLVGSNFKRFGPDEYHGPCFKCGGNHRFIVFGNGMAWCRQCQWRGDSIQLLRDRDGLSYIDAAAKVGRDLEPQTQKKQQKVNRRVTPAMRASTPKDVQFDQAAWSGMAHKLMDRAIEVMHFNADGQEAESYLRGRGLSLAALTGAFIGYIPTRFETNWGGLKVVVERGISIPWFDGSQVVHKVNVRTDNQDKSKRYKAVTGSTNGAYLSYRVRPGSVVVLVEGEIDALSVASATDWKINGVATGSTMGGRLLSVVAKLAMARRVLVAFDSDEPGENAAQWWLQALPNARRHLPTRHDVNDMLQIDGPDGVQQWIASGFKDMRPVRPATPPTPTPAAPAQIAPAKAITLPGMGGGSSYHNGGL